MLKACVVLVFLGVTFTYGAKLPSFFSKCKKSDPKFNDCVMDNLKKGFDEFKKGDNSHHIQSVSPLKVPNMLIDVDGGLIINLTDATFQGFEQSVFTLFKMDFDKKVINLEFDIPTQLNCQSQYDINGRILILPIQGKGPMNVTYIKPHVTYTLTYDLEKQGGKEYLVPKSNTFIYTIQRAYFELHNLFNGDKRLGEEMLKFLNENWKEVNEEIGLKLGEALGEVIMHLLASFFRKVPFNELIDD